MTSKNELKTLRKQLSNEKYILKQKEEYPELWKLRRKLAERKYRLKLQIKRNEKKIIKYKTELYQLEKLKAVPSWELLDVKI